MSNDQHELAQLHDVFEKVSELTKSDSPIVRDTATIMQGLAYNVIRQLDVENEPLGPAQLLA
jgi:hypothetical protein